MNQCYRLGIDIGSTTVKVAVIDDNNKILFADYERHYANIQETLASLLKKCKGELGELSLRPNITGSGGLTLSGYLHIPFVQEVVAVATALQDYAPRTDVAIELGGEDAKIIYFTGGIDQRMNGICAGGTGSFIDQMASLLQTDAAGLNEYAKNYKALYPIAARCGVFAKTDIQPLINEGATKEDLSASDDSVIAAYFKAHTDVAVKKGDVFVVTTTVGNSTYEKSAYFYDGKAWVAMTGNVDADKVILRDNITLAGGYTQVGNLTKSQNGTSIFSTKGKSVMDALTEIFSKRLQPTITAQPSIGTFTLTGAGAVEAGTKVAAAAYSAASLNAGSYQYGPATGVTATNWKVERITNAATTQVATASAASLTAGSDNNSGAGFIIGDAGGDNAVSSLKYRVTATHGAGVTAKDNLGAASSPVVAIAAGTKTKDTGAYTPFRNTFYGTSTGKPALDSAAIRALGKTGKAYAAGTLTLNVPAGTQRVAIACIATAKGVTKVINETAMNADVTSTFTKSTVSVEGANGYAAKDYNVWVFEPAVAYGNAAVLKVTLG